MGKKKKKGVAAPSGLQIGRNQTSFNLSWKRGTSYSAQNLQINRGNRWENVGVGGGASSAAVYYSQRIQFRVQGKKGKKWSAWATSGWYTNTAPNNPAVSREVTSVDTTVFKWNVGISDTDNRPFSRIDWESVLIKDSNTPNGANVNWWDSSRQTGSSGATDSSWSRTESGWRENNYSYTRWFRARAVGPFGTTGWFYASRAFAMPEKARNVSATRTARSDGGFTVAASWTSPATYAKPIDKVTVRYLKSNPRVTVEFPSTDTGQVKMGLLFPNDGSASWTALTDVSGVGGYRGMSFTDNNDLTRDQCLFLQVNNTYNELTTEGTPILVNNGIGKLANPSVPVVSSGGIDRLYTVSVTRNTSINEAAIAVYWRSSSTQDSPVLIGIIEGAHDGRDPQTSTQCIIPEFPDGDAISFGVQAFVGNYSPLSYPSSHSLSDDEPTYYDVNAVMTSDIVWGEGVPLPPRNVAVVKINDSTVQVGWTWSWTDATNAELSWADHEDAWESTSQPQTFDVNNNNVGRWNITGLAVGTWYIRVRLFKKSGDTNIYGAYSPTQVIKLSSSPDTPALMLSDSVISKTGSVTCYWAYVSTDGTAQKQGEVCEAFPNYEEVSAPTGDPADQGWYELVDEKYVKTTDIEVDSEKTYYYVTGEMTYSDPIASVSSAQHITVNAEDQGWDSNETHYLAVRVMSVSGESSEGWSNPVPLSIAEELECHITSHQFVDKTIPVTGGEPVTVLSLTSLPTTIEASAAGSNGTLTYILERAESYDLDRPDGSEYQGFEGETVYIQDSGNTCTITQEDLIGVLDDGAKYNLIVIAKDSYGQTDEDNIEFEVHWDHQAIIPQALVEADKENHVTMITPILPEEGYIEGDVCDIYRLSADEPELIVEGASFGTKYVDPYPAFGDFGGVRIVYRTVNGDYITADNTIAWSDYNADDDPNYMHDLFGLVIDFDGEELILPYNVSIGNSWSKDFTLTKYLGGSVQGDWNPAIEKSVSANTVIPVEVEPDNMTLVRELAVYPGICHVRLPDGSSFTANVEVKDDREEKWTRRLSKVSLSITACEAQGYEGMTYAEWIDQRTD